MIIILTVTGATGKIWYSGFDLESIVGMIHRKVKVDPCVCLFLGFYGRGKGYDSWSHRPK